MYISSRLLFFVVFVDDILRTPILTVEALMADDDTWFVRSVVEGKSRDTS